MPGDSFLVYSLGEQRFAMPAEAVERVLLAAEITSLSETPACVAGLLNLEGVVLPVLDLRRLLDLPTREPDAADRFIVLRAGGRTLALWVDDVPGVIERPPETLQPAEQVVPGIKRVRSVGRIGDDILLIHDLDALLSADERSQLDHALTRS